MYHAVFGPRSYLGHGAHLTSVRAPHATHHHDAPVALVLLLRVGIVALAAQLPHGRRGVLKREEGGEAVRLEAFLQVGGGGGVDGWRAQETGGADPDVEAAPGVEDVVDEGQGVLLVGGGERVGDYLRGGGEGRGSGVTRGVGAG